MLACWLADAIRDLFPIRRGICLIIILAMLFPGVRITANHCTRDQIEGLHDVF